LNEAALVAARSNRKVVHAVRFELAKDKVMMGVERKSLSSATKRRRTLLTTRQGMRWSRR